MLTVQLFVITFMYCAFLKYGNLAIFRPLAISNDITLNINQQNFPQFCRGT
jgi:hypothetical protein